MLPSPFQVYNVLHNKPQKGGWRNDEEFNQYVRMTFDLYLFLDVVISVKLKIILIHLFYDRKKILQHKEDAMDKLLAENTTITPALEHELEEEAIKSVCGREKTRKSGYEVMNGPILKKKRYVNHFGCQTISTSFE